MFNPSPLRSWRLFCRKSPRSSYLLQPDLTALSVSLCSTRRIHTGHIVTSNTPFPQQLLNKRRADRAIVVSNLRLLALVAATVAITGPAIAPRVCPVRADLMDREALGLRVEHVGMRPAANAGVHS